MLGNGDCICAAVRGYRHANPLGSFEINIVGTDAQRLHELQVTCLLPKPGRQIAWEPYDKLNACDVSKKPVVAVTWIGNCKFEPPR